MFDSPKDPSDTITVEFDFTDKGLASIASAVVASSIDWAGATADPSPASMVSGSAQINGLVVLQEIVGGLDLHDYDLRCTATAPDGKVAVLASTLMVRQLPV